MPAMTGETNRAELHADQRKQFAEILGLHRDERSDPDGFEYHDVLAEPRAEAPGFRLHPVRWRAFAQVYGTGLLFEPKATPIANVIAIPDAAQSAEELAAIKNSILFNRAMEIDFTVQNLVFTELDIEVSVRLEGGFTLAQVFSNIAEDLVSFIDWKLWTYGELVPRSDLISLINNTVGVDFINTGSFVPKNNRNVTAASLPRLRGLVVTNLDDAVSRTSVAVTQKQPV